MTGLNAFRENDEMSLAELFGVATSCFLLQEANNNKLKITKYFLIVAIYA